MRGRERGGWKGGVRETQPLYTWHAGSLKLATNLRQETAGREEARDTRVKGSGGRSWRGVEGAWTLSATDFVKF